jgi:hypothetical protein
MSRLDQSGTITAMLRMLAWEQDPRVREQAIVLVGYMRSTSAQIEPVCAALLKAFQASTNENERMRILEITSNLPCPETVKLIGAIVPTLGTNEENIELQIGAADAVLKLSTGTPVDKMLSESVLEPLKLQAKSAKSRGLRARLIRLLAAPARGQLPFLLELLSTEKTSNVKETITDVTENLKLAQ